MGLSPIILEDIDLGYNKDILDGLSRNQFIVAQRSLATLDPAMKK